MTNYSSATVAADILAHSHNIIAINPLFVDIVGDLEGAAILAQINYWFLPSASGHSKLRVQIDGKLWLAKQHDDWWNEIRVSAQVAAKRLKRLEEMGIIKTCTKRFNGLPITHIWLDKEALSQKVVTFLSKQQERENPLKESLRSYQNDKNVPIEMIETITETTAKTTTKDDDLTATQTKEKFEPVHNSDSSCEEPLDPLKSYVIIPNSYGPKRYEILSLISQINQINAKYSEVQIKDAIAKLDKAKCVSDPVQYLITIMENTERDRQQHDNHKKRSRTTKPFVCSGGKYHDEKLAREEAEFYKTHKGKKKE